MKNYITIRIFLKQSKKTFSDLTDIVNLIGKRLTSNNKHQDPIEIHVWKGTADDIKQIRKKGWIVKIVNP